ncbi:hypothetical protein ACP70R_026569 [Stipagrostis hirtigluma subsp. patula]
MEQTRATGAGGQPTAAAGSEPAKRGISGDAPAAVAGGGCFDCNICLDPAAEPVVTLCGHLYCWPCIYEWLRPDADAAATRSPARRQCPVCKAAVSPDELVPLYGRGGSSSSKKPPPGLASIPRRPAVRAQHSEDIGHGHHRHRSAEIDAAARQPRQARYDADAARFDAILPPPFGDRGMMHSTAGGVLCGMAVAVLPWVLRGQVQPPSLFYPSPYHHLSPRQRRRHMELERSLHQIWFFLFVFVVLCLLLF